MKTDTIILATALGINADYIVTNDMRFRDICEQEGIGIIDLNKE